MMPILEPPLLEVLNHFHNRFKNKMIESHIKLEHNSLLLTVIRLQPNKLSKLLSDSAINNNSFVRAELESLADKGYIRSLNELGKPDDYAITIAGIWSVELNKNEMDLIRLLNYFQETQLTFKVSHKPLKDIEKTILFAMITIRNFSIDLPMDINNTSFRDYWMEIFDLCAEFLHKTGVVSNKEWNTFRPGNEHPISHVMRRANDLPQKTKNIYQTLGRNRYFIDVDNGNPQKQLFFLYKSIFGVVAKKDLVKDIHLFCCDIAYDKSKNVRETFEYISPEWDTILEEALNKLYYET